MIIKHRDYIQQQIPIGLDHVRVRKNGFYYVNPPTYDLDTEAWGKDIIESVEVKIGEILDRFDFVEQRYQHNTALIHQTYDHLDDLTSEFFLTLEAEYATEIIYLRKWLKYWQRVYETASLERLVSEEFKTDKFTDEQIERAKESPIEDMYEGDLRGTPGRLVGLCPFHEEKTPSFTIFTGDNNFHCFGCHAHGDAIDFWMKSRNVDFIQAVKDLLNE